MQLYSLLVIPGILCIINHVFADNCASVDTCKVNSGDDIFLECQDKKPVHWEYPRQDIVPESNEYGEILEDAYINIPEDSEIHTSESSVPDENGFYTANLTITKAIYKDTGFYKCLRKSKRVVKEKYYFVVDDLQLLVEDNYANFYGYFLRRVVIPCKPTDPDVKVSLIKDGGSIVRLGIHDGRTITYDARYGYIINPAHASDMVPYVCMAKKGVTQNRTYLLNLHEYEKIKIPMINESNWVPDVREGDDLFVVCSEKASSFEFNWTTPQDPEDDRLSFIKKDCDDKTCSILRVNNVSLDDSGEYECAVKDEDSSYSANKTIFVFGKNEHFLNLQIDYEPSKSQCQKIGAYVTWVIDLRYSEIPELQWYNPKGKEIKNDNNKFHIVTNEKRTRTSLTVSKITFDDNGNYTLLAKTPYQQATYSVSLELKSTLDVWIRSNDGKWKSGQMFEHKKYYNLTCRAKGYPKPELKWVFYPCIVGQKCDDVERPVKSAPTKFMHGEYHYPYRFYVEQSGHLKCIATNKNCNYTKIEEIEVRITDVAGNNKELHIWTDPVEVVEKDTVNLTCAASTYNYTNDIEWYRMLPGDGLLNISEYSSEYLLDMYSTVYTHRAVLTIHNISQKNDGSYMCKVKNLNGNQDNVTYTLNVAKEMAPFLKSTNLNVTELPVRPGLPAMLYCRFKGMPSPQIVWTKDGKQINATSRIQLKNKNETLNIPAFQREDEGKYTCFAKNRIDQVSKSIMLVELGKQGIPKPLIAAITICSIFLIVLLVVLFVKIRKERKLRKELALAGLANFVKGVPECINPDLPVDEQADLLPYDKKWEFPRERLRLGKQLGAGAFGVVLKAEAQGILPGQEWTTVAVKMAKSGMADRTYLRALASELKIMTHLGQHLNVVNLLGACTKNLARRMELLVIVEFCRYGNLHNYLLRRRDNFVNQVDPDTGEVNLALGQEKLAYTPTRLFARSKSLLKQRLFSFASNTGQSSAPSSPGPMGSGEDSSGYLVEADECLLSSSSSEQPEWRVRYGGDYKGAQTGPICTQDLICWGFQVARGMEYLASRRVLHGDLAARNLLLADNNVVKICDFGLAKSMYKTDNYRKKGAGPLPVKWMAPESISDRVFSTQSDIWSFGIVLWELFSLAQTPYPGMSADENLYRKLQDGYRMEQPPNATNAIYSIMLRCWEKHPDKRPSFSEIAELLGATLDGNVRRHFEELNDPYIVMNKNYHEGEDYLKMMSAPDYTNMTVRDENEYVNSPEGSSQAPDYLQMTGNPKDIFSPRISNEVFEFPSSDYLSMGAKQPQDSDKERDSQTERKPSGSKYVNIEDKNIAVSNPNYR